MTSVKAFSFAPQHGLPECWFAWCSGALMIFGRIHFRFESEVRKVLDDINGSSQGLK
jgi:hypothetical protein